MKEAIPRNNFGIKLNLPPGSLVGEYTFASKTRSS